MLSVQISFSLLQATTKLNHQIKDDKPQLQEATPRDQDPHTSLLQPQHIQHKHKHTHTRQYAVKK